jgi:hypothetical protein
MTVSSPTNQPGYFQRYINLVPEKDLFIAFTAQQARLESLLQRFTETQSLHRYAPDKWSVRELLLHLADSERIFCYRALCFARGEAQPLPGFEENDYAASSEADSRSWASLSEEMLAVRKATLLLFKGFSAAMLTHTGTANGQSHSVEAIGFILLGHFYHHEKIIQERYC